MLNFCSMASPIVDHSVTFLFTFASGLSTRACAHGWSWNWGVESVTF